MNLFGSQTDTLTPGQSGPGNKVNEGELYNPQNSKTGVSPPDAI